MTSISSVGLRLPNKQKLEAEMANPGFHGSSTTHGAPKTADDNVGVVPGAPTEAGTNQFMTDKI